MCRLFPRVSSSTTLRTWSLSSRTRLSSERATSSRPGLGTCLVSVGVPFRHLLVPSCKPGRICRDADATAYPSFLHIRPWYNKCRWRALEGAAKGWTRVSQRLQPENSQRRGSRQVPGQNRRVPGKESGRWNRRGSTGRIPRADEPANGQDGLQRETAHTQIPSISPPLYLSLLTTRPRSHWFSLNRDERVTEID